MKMSLNLTLKGPGKSWNPRCQNMYEPCANVVTDIAINTSDLIPLLVLNRTLWHYLYMDYVCCYLKWRRTVRLHLYGLIHVAGFQIIFEAGGPEKRQGLMTNIAHDRPRVGPSGLGVRSSKAPRGINCRNDSVRNNLR